MRNAIIFALFALFFGVDVFMDFQEGLPISHIWFEALLLFISIGAMTLQIRTILQKEAHISSLKAELLETKKSYQEWKEKTQASAEKIREQIDVQFGLWHLSNSEKDVALLLIKGLSMKEIADIRQTHEKTVRQQATTIYKKANLSGRQELAAFFLEDILSQPLQTP